MLLNYYNILYIVMRLKENKNLPVRDDTMTTDREEWWHCSMQSDCTSVPLPV